jgi:probable O-glycosylation ligase (exosortase A-associated)
MLRTIFVFGVILVGIVYAFQGPFYLLLFYLWNAYFRPEQWMWVDYVSPLKLSFGIGVLLLLTSINALARFRLTLLVGLILLFLGQSLLSTVLSEHFDYSMGYWIEFLKVLLISIMITVLVTDRQRYRLTLLVIGLSLGLEQAKQGWAQLVLNPGATNNNMHPVLGDNNGVAVGMMMLVPVFVALAQTAGKRWERNLHRFLIVGLIYRGISTYSRGGFLAAAALGLVTLWRSPKKFRAIIVIVTLALMVASVMPQRFWDRMQTLTAPAEQQDDSAQGRLYYWQVAIRMGNEKPLTGVGFNGFKPSFTRYDFSGGTWGVDRAVHSAWFGALAEMGYPGLVLLVAVIVVAFVTCWRVRRSARDPALKDFRAYAGAMQATLVVYVVGVTFLNGQYNEMFWHFIGLTVALDGAYASALQPATAVVPVSPVTGRGFGAPALGPVRAPR